MSLLINDTEYLKIIDDIRLKIKSAQHRAVLAANGELISLYWHIGTVINEHSVWGNKFVENLARDIKRDFPDATGYSIRNLKYMAKFAKMFPDFVIVHAPLAQITWYHMTEQQKTERSNKLCALSSTMSLPAQRTCMKVLLR